MRTVMTTRKQRTAAPHQLAPRGCIDVSSPVSTVIPVVAESLELCFQLSTALVTDRFSHGRPQTRVCQQFRMLINTVTLFARSVLRLVL